MPEHEMRDDCKDMRDDYHKFKDDLNNPKDGVIRQIYATISAKLGCKIDKRAFWTVVVIFVGFIGGAYGYTTSVASEQDEMVKKSDIKAIIETQKAQDDKLDGAIYIQGQVLENLKTIDKNQEKMDVKLDKLLEKIK